MKYMGSKRWMLQNGLGKVLRSECSQARGFVDLFAGSGAVASYVAQNCFLPVLASDLQGFSIVLTKAIIGRESALDADQIWGPWSKRAKAIRSKIQIPKVDKLTHANVRAYRTWSGRRNDCPITQAYGGHYFSPAQAIWIDALRQTLPERDPSRTVALAALVCAASQCAASPGHTAQPFQPTRTAKQHLKEAWDKNILAHTRTALNSMTGQFALKEGDAFVADANETAGMLTSQDVAFIDPPYSGVHYSRFYHVLETISKGESGAVSGVGRYPPRVLRPQSRYSVKTQSLAALEDLLRRVSEKGATAILTFPDHECSNGLSGSVIREKASQFFRVTAKTVESKFSTLGGNNKTGETNKGRKARQTAKELILILKPRG
ncbi:MAG: DNA adenine methylase [Sedimentisphaerales bacterium]|nr:DNA adenine methylase [Sedimentisphaerales bacterium]